LKHAVAAFGLPNARVLTDVVGDFNQVVMEFTAENLAAIEKRMQETMGSPQYRERMAGYTGGSHDLVLSGNAGESLRTLVGGEAAEGLLRRAAL
jgi:hypothetical protein